MAQHSVTKTINAHPDRIWALLSDFTNVAWIPLTGRVEIEGSGPGMRRRVFGKGGSDRVKLGAVEVDDDAGVVERVISIDDERHRFVYCIDENNPMPVGSYVVTADVNAGPSGGSVVCWTVDFESEEEEAVVTAIDAVYQMIAGWLEDAAR